MKFVDWIQKYLSYSDQIGDLARDIKMDPKILKIKNDHNEIKEYLSLYEMDETRLKVFDVAWTLYQTEKLMNKEGDSKMSENVVFESAKKLIVERQLSGNRMGINDDLTNTNLISKNYSPLFIRKMNCVNGWPLYISMIVDEDISDIDQVVNDVIKACNESGLLSNNLQNLRNFTGILSESLINHYNSKKENCVEGVAILFAADKAMIANLWGDYMNHTMCRSEWYSLLNMMPHI